MPLPFNDAIARSIEEALEAPLLPDSGGKIIPLSEAIRRKVKPGMMLYIGTSANAATRDIVRQFHHSKPDFTIIGGSQYFMDALVHCRLVSRLIGSVFAYLLPVTRPVAAIQRAYRDKALEIEDWTVLTLVQRLMAGAMDQSGMLTKSMIGTSMAKENSAAFKEIDDPFRPGAKLNLVKALNPDLAIVHGWAADTRGNVILGVPNLTGVDVWGSLASRGGVIVTVEKIVSPEFIRKHSCLVQIPAHMVESVSQVSFGAHPDGMTAWGMNVKEFAGYDPDLDYIIEHVAASRDAAAFSNRLKEWVIDCPSHENYLDKLGEMRISGLRTRKRGWKTTLAKTMASIPVTPDYTSSEMMMVAGARKIREIMLKGNYKSLLIGMGQAGMAGRLAYYRMRKEGYPIVLIVGTGIIGFSPRPANTRLATSDNIMTGEMLGNSFETYGTFVGGLNNRCLALLGAGQIDFTGNINSTRMAEGEYLVGSGGANDGMNAEEAIVILPQSKTRYVSKVHYVTCTGDRIRTVVSDLGIYEKRDDDSTFSLVAYYPTPDGSTKKTDLLKRIRESCNWNLKVASDATMIAPPTLEELLMLRVFDPKGLFTGKVQK